MTTTTVAPARGVERIVDRSSLGPAHSVTLTHRQYLDAALGAPVTPVGRAFLDEVVGSTESVVRVAGELLDRLHSTQAARGPRSL